MPHARRGPQKDAARGAEAKLLWVRSQELESGAPGLILVHRGETVAYALYMPAEEAHRARRLGSTPSDDALVLATMWVAPSARESGVAKAMLHSVLKHAHDAGLRAVEAIGARGDASPCMLPEPFLIANGFVVHHEHPSYPLLRLDLRQTARWQEAMEHALEGVRAALSRRERNPAPSSA
ncbi:MAG TPA: GNAT family N-acetyltransferase [Euzebyales bacterium]|nr:GNAT family N-acetyltransferase [Euzebyales bacterium]